MPEDLCNDDARLDLEGLFIPGVTDPSGSWSIIDDPGGSNPGTLSGSSFDATDADDGTYQIQYQLPNAPDGCPDVATVSIVVADAPSSGIAPR